MDFYQFHISLIDFSKKKLKTISAKRQNKNEWFPAPLIQKSPRPLPLKKPPPFKQNNLQQLELTAETIIYTWGKDIGDIHISWDHNSSFLLLSGYISELPGHPLLNQQELCEHLRLLIDNSPSSQTISTVIATLYGSFSIIYISLKEQIVWSCTDRLASRPLWYHKNKNDLSISSHAISIAHHTGSKNYSPNGLASYLLYATQLDPTHSLFQEISCQKEGTILQSTLNQEAPNGETQWYQFKHIPDNNRSVSSWIQLTADCFVSAAERLLKTTSNPLLFLSGGVDSRLAGAALTAAGGSPALHIRGFPKP